MMIALEVLYGFISALPCLSQLPQRSTVSQDMATEYWVLATCIRLPCFSIFAHLSRGSHRVHWVPSGSYQVPAMPVAWKSVIC